MPDYNPNHIQRQHTLGSPDLPSAPGAIQTSQTFVFARNERGETAAQELTDIITELSDIQMRWLAVRVACVSNVEANRRLAGPTDPVRCHNWQYDPAMKRALQLMRVCVLEAATNVLHRHVLEAVYKKVDGMRSKDERIAQAAASDILNRAGLSAPAQVDHTVTRIDLNKWADQRADRLKDALAVLADMPGGSPDTATTLHPNANPAHYRISATAPTATAAPTPDIIDADFATCPVPNGQTA